MSRLVRLYPRAWRQRYGDELAELLAREGLTVRGALDVIVGALDAHLHPLAGGASREVNAGPAGGTAMIGGVSFHCASTPAMSKAEALRSAFVIIAVSAAFAAAALALRRTLGAGVLVDALNAAGFPAALAVWASTSILKRHSLLARAIFFLVVVGLPIAAALVARLL
jgi:hypothetical protein